MWCIMQIWQFLYVEVVETHKPRVPHDMNLITIKSTWQGDKTCIKQTNTCHFRWS